MNLGPAVFLLAGVLCLRRIGFRMMVHFFALCWSQFSDTPLLVINREVNRVFDKGEVLVPW